MATKKAQKRGDDQLVFAAFNVHSESSGQPPRLRNSDNPDVYYGYFENFDGEQFVFTFDRVAKTGTVWGGDLGWGAPKTFTCELVAEALRSTQWLAAQVHPPELLAAAGVPIVDAALALGRLTGLTGKEEVIWLRACLKASMWFETWPEADRDSSSS